MTDKHLRKGGITSYPRTHQKRVRDKKGAPHALEKLKALEEELKAFVERQREKERERKRKQRQKNKAPKPEIMSSGC